MVKHFIYGAAAIGILFCGVVCPADSATLPRYGVFFYSNQCIQSESGDASGGTVKLTRTPQGDSVEYGWSAEGPMEVVTAIDVHIDSGTKIRFTVPPTPYTIYEHTPHYFSGTISTSDIRLSGYSVPALIPRQKMEYKPQGCS